MESARRLDEYGGGTSKCCSLGDLHSFGWDVHNWKRAARFCLDRSGVELHRSRVLEVGGGPNCGLVSWLSWNAPDGSYVFSSVDNVRGSGTCCRDACSGARRDRQVCARFDVLDLGVRAGSVDLVVSKSVVGAVGRGGDVRRIQAMFGEISRVLKPDGEYWLLENVAGSILHSQLRRRFGAGRGSWYYPRPSALHRFLADHFETLDYELFGVAGCFPRSEAWRHRLGVVDERVLESLLPKNVRYVGAFRLRRRPPVSA